MNTHNLILCAFIMCASVTFVHAEQENSKCFTPPGAIRFSFYEQEVDRELLQRIEFTRNVCNLTLRNKTGVALKPKIRVIVLNENGVVLWRGGINWIFDTLKPDAKAFESVDFKCEMPSELIYSEYAASFDVSPKWIIINAESKE